MQIIHAERNVSRPADKQAKVELRRLFCLQKVVERSALGEFNNNAVVIRLFARAVEFDYILVA